GIETNTIKTRAVSKQLYEFDPVNMGYQSSAATQLATGLISACTPTQAIIGIQVNTQGCSTPVTLSQLQLNMNGTTNINDIKLVHVYYTGNSAVYSPTGEFVSGGTTPAAGTLMLNGSQALAQGTNYFWVTYEVYVGAAAAGDAIDAQCTQLTVAGVGQAPTVTSPAGNGTFTACSSSPGGVAGEAFWIKTTNGVPTTTDGTAIASWSDQSGNTRTATSPAPGNYPTYRDNSTNNINFNPVVDFNSASSNYLAIPSNGLLATGNNTYSVYAVVNPGNGNVSTPGKFLFGGTAGTDNFSAFGLGSSNSFVDSWSGDDLAANSAWTTGTPTLASFNFTGTQRELYVAGSLAGTLVGSARNSADVNDAIGARMDVGTSEYFSGSIAEIVTYPNTSHSAAARNKIESYLGLKYGITLQHDYVSSAGTTIWSRSLDAAYNTNIMGIGRDDNSVLSQKQGTSTSSPDMLTVYIGSSKTVNQSANTGSFAGGDKSFFMIANNNAQFMFAYSTTGEMPSGISNRVQRKWLAQLTNFTNTDVSLVFDFNVATTGTMSINPSDLRLLVDNDGNFSDAAIIGTPTASFSVSGNVVTVTVPASSFSGSPYFTLGSVSSATSLPVVISGFNAVCKNNKVQVGWTKLSSASSTYSIERSSDGRNFATAGVVSSSSTGVQSLTWTDPSPLGGVSYYRLKIADENDIESYSAIASVTSCSIDNTRIASDPVTGQSTLLLQLQQNASVAIDLFDVLGRRMDISGLTGTHAMTAGAYRLPVTSGELVKGVYLLSVTINGNKNTFRIVQP
ncbi:MAG TPA: BNR-repeat neuraminidase N-terminal domain-containing protein, partial [Chitinophagaceae bacterium]